MNIDRFTVPLTTDSSGAATAYTPTFAWGHVLAIHYIKDSFADGVDFNLTAEATGQTIWQENNVNASALRYPRQATHGTDGIAALYAAGGTAVLDLIALA